MPVETVEAEERGGTLRSLRCRSVALVCVEGFDLLRQLQFSFCEEFVSDEWRLIDAAAIGDEVWGFDWRENTDDLNRSFAIHRAKRIPVDLTAMDWQKQRWDHDLLYFLLESVNMMAAQVSTKSEDFLTERVVSFPFTNENWR